MLSRRSQLTTGPMPPIPRRVGAAPVKPVVDLETQSTRELERKANQRLDLRIEPQKGVRWAFRRPRDRSVGMEGGFLVDQDSDSRFGQREHA